MSARCEMCAAPLESDGLCAECAETNFGPLWAPSTRSVEGDRSRARIGTLGTPGQTIGNGPEAAKADRDSRRDGNTFPSVALKTGRFGPTWERRGFNSPAVFVHGAGTRLGNLGALCRRMDVGSHHSACRVAHKSPAPFHLRFA